MKITALILTGFFIIAVGSLALLAKKLRNNIEIQYSQAAEEPLVDFAHLFSSLIERDIDSGHIDPERFRESFENAYRREFLARIYNLEKNRIHTQIYITNREGIVVFDTENRKREGQDFSRYNDVYLAAQGKYGARSSRTDPKNSETSVFYIGVPIYFHGEIVGTLTVSRPETAMAPFADESRYLVAKWSITAAATTVALGALWIYWLLSPVGRLTKSAREIAAGRCRALPETGHAEFRTLSRVLEEMRRELEGKHYVENYVQALTHELKSPLAAIRGAAELINDSMPPDKRIHFLGNILSETDRCEQLVRRLVQLAAIENQATLAQLDRFSLSTLINEVLAEFGPAAESKNLVIRFEATENVASEIEGDRMMLQIGIGNLVKNAIDFSPDGGQITVLLDGPGDDDKYLISVSDEGPGIPEYAKGRVFERFYSLKNQQTGRKGSGLGLCFVKEATDLHHGEIRLESAQGKGTLALMVLPARR